MRMGFRFDRTVEDIEEANGWPRSEEVHECDWDEKRNEDAVHDVTIKH